MWGGKIPQSKIVMYGMCDWLDTNKTLIKPLSWLGPMLFQFRRCICKITEDVRNIWWYHPWLICLGSYRHFQCEQTDALAVYVLAWLSWSWVCCDSGNTTFLLQAARVARCWQLGSVWNESRGGGKISKHKWSQLLTLMWFHMSGRGAVFTSPRLSVGLQIHNVRFRLCMWTYAPLGLHMLVLVSKHI